jgi:hypothetical protein
LETKVTAHNFSVAEFAKAQNSMIQKSTDNSSSLGWQNYGRKTKNYSRKEVTEILDRGSETTKRELSRSYFYRDGFYRRILIYYATMLKYTGVLIPNLKPQVRTGFSDKQIARYDAALEFVEQANFPTLLTNFTLKALIDGAYYGIIVSQDKNSLVVLDLPADYCRTRFKDLYGKDIIEFNLQYFDRLTDESTRSSALASYPEEVAKAYRKWHKGKRSTSWIIIPSDIGVCFSPFEEVSPLFLSTILASLDYDEAVDTEKQRDKEEIKKIIVQKIPHNSENQLLFEPEEAVEIHAGTVGMMKHNENVDVLTTYADVDVITSKTTSDNATNSLEKMTTNVYNEAGTTRQLFSADSSMSIELSIDNDTAMMMALFGDKYSIFITEIVNKLFGKGNISFKYKILPITYYNAEKYTDSTFKIAASGYSYLLPALGCGLSQRDLTSIKDLENEVLKLDQRLKPLQSAFTQTPSSSDEGGRPSIDAKDKNPSTIQKEESLNG